MRVIIHRVDTHKLLAINPDNTGATLSPRSVSLCHKQHIQCSVTKMEWAVQIPRLLHNYLKFSRDLVYRWRPRWCLVANASLNHLKALLDKEFARASGLADQPVELGEINIEIARKRNGLGGRDKIDAPHEIQNKFGGGFGVGAWGNVRKGLGIVLSDHGRVVLGAPAV